MKTRLQNMILLILTGLCLGLYAQEPAAPGKRPLTHEDYDRWRSIVSSTISPDGKWISYLDSPQDGDAQLVAVRLSDKTTYSYGIGYTGEGTDAERSAKPSFSYDGKHLVFLVSKDKDAVKSEKKDKQKKEDKPARKLGIMDLSSGEVTLIDSVKSYSMAEESGGWVAFLKEKPKKDKKKDSDKEESEEKEEKEEKSGKEEEEKEKDKKKKKDFGCPFILRSLEGQTEYTFIDVLHYRFTKNGKLFVIVSSEDSTETDGVYQIVSGTMKALLTGEGSYTRWKMNKDETHLAFLTDKNDQASETPSFDLYGLKVGEQNASLWVSTDNSGFPANRVVNDKGDLTFSEDGSALMFSVKEAPEEDEESAEENEDEDDKDGDDEKAEFDLWHWNDPYPQPQQKKMAKSVRENGPEYVYFTKSQKLVQLGDDNILDVSLSRNGKVAYANHTWPYTKRVSYYGSFNDVYVFNTRTGKKALVKKELYGSARLSPNAKFLLWFEEANWFIYSIRTGKTINLTEQLKVSFSLEDWDTPNPARPYGIAGWTDNDKSVLIYDRYDIWECRSDGSSTRRLFDGYGRKNNLSLRYIKLDPEAVTVDPGVPMLFSATHQATMTQGFFKGRLTDATPKELIMEGKGFGRPRKAKNADVLLYTRSAFDEYPDLWISGPDFIGPQKVTDLGSQMEGIIWGSSELINFKSADGLDLKGILVRPDNFDPSKKYPLLVYIYETLHSGLHRYRNPSPGTSINPSYYVSNGYVLWMPDIEYHTGYPGEDALKCVLPGVQMLIRKGFIDPEAVGIAGHSWGGYQIAYMITQTDVFKAVESGAPVSNMTSAYGGIRWGSGMVRQFQYERTQSRLGGSLWEVPLRYIENSPVFWADKVNTPILMIHNDKDGAVPWYQGIEYIMALRRLGKEAYMFNYLGEDHGLRKRVNQEDWTIRMAEFFEHHLKGRPAPDWMKTGIKAWEKEEEEK